MEDDIDKFWLSNIYIYAADNGFVQTRDNFSVELYQKR